jgi:hypothetical protein
VDLKAVPRSRSLAGCLIGNQPLGNQPVQGAVVFDVIARGFPAEDPVPVGNLTQHGRYLADGGPTAVVVVGVPEQ